MKLLATFCLAVICQTAPAMDRLTALACCESGGCDTVVGPDGELSRYQIAPSVAADFQIDPALLTNPVFARACVEKILTRRLSTFALLYHRQPDDFEFYLLW